MGMLVNAGVARQVVVFLATGQFES